MISSRRLAREWALRILYQRDVGKSTLDEALDSALERLRLEFVQRGSRSASGSTAEQICLDYLTGELRPALIGLQHSYERAVVAATGRLVAEAPYWQELRLERAFKGQAPGVALTPPRLLSPLAPNQLVVQIGNETGLTAQQRAQLSAFVMKSWEELPLRLDVEIRKSALQFARELAAERPLGGGPADVQRFLQQRRSAYNDVQTERWQQIAAVVQKQMGDWLRTAGFTVKLVVGADTRHQEIDEAISALSAGWRLERQAAVDRNILRLAGYEILYLAAIPAGVAINEAVELAKKYSTTESGRFVNGVLGALATQVGERRSGGIAQDALDLDGADDTLDLPDITTIDDNDLEDNELE